MPFVSEQRRNEIIQQVLTARAERVEFLAKMKARQSQGWVVAREAAKQLKVQFGATKVVLFGSMLDHHRMTEHSDIDLAVAGLSKADFFKAGAAIDRCQPFKIDLVMLETAPDFLTAAIEDGTEL